MPHEDRWRTGGRHRRCALERAGRDGRRGDALRHRRDRPGDARRVPLRYRLRAHPPDRPRIAEPLAARPRLDRRRAARGVLLRAVLRDLQRRDELHHRRARLARALHAAARHHGGGRGARPRSAYRAQVARRDHRCRRRGRRARDGSCRGAGRGMARRPHHGGGHALHGVLQRLVAAVHGAIELARFPGGGHGLRLGLQHARRLAERRSRRRGAGLRAGAMDGSDRPRRASAARRHSICGCSHCSARRRRAWRTR